MSDERSPAPPDESDHRDDDVAKAACPVDAWLREASRLSAAVVHWPAHVDMSAASVDARLRECAEISRSSPQRWPQRAKGWPTNVEVEYMGKVHDAIDERLRAFIEAQKMFFVATAPSGDGGHVNLSPKGLDSLRVLGPTTIDVTRISDSCGYGVPIYAFERERTQLPDWAEKKGDAAIEAYKAKNNRQSLDRLPALRRTEGE